MAQFITWLRNQQDRTDAIGRLAMAASRDQEFPKANKLNIIVDYLKRKGANDKLLDTVENAYAEFENAPRRKSRKATAEATTRAKPAPKTAETLPPKPTLNRPGPVAAAKPKTETAAAPKPALAKQTRTAVTEPTANNPAPAKLTKAGSTKTATEPKPGKAERNTVTPTVAQTKPQKAEPQRAEQTSTAQPQVKRAAQTATPKNQPAQRNRQNQNETAMAQLPERLLPLQRQLADASFVLDAQFGKGYSAKNATQVLEFARMLLTAEQNRMLHYTFADLAEALHRVASRLDSVMRQPY